MESKLFSEADHRQRLQNRPSRAELLNAYVHKTRARIKKLYLLVFDPFFNASLTSGVFFLGIVLNTVLTFLPINSSPSPIYEIQRFNASTNTTIVSEDTDLDIVSNVGNSLLAVLYLLCGYILGLILLKALTLWSLRWISVFKYKVRDPGYEAQLFKHQDQTLDRIDYILSLYTLAILVLYTSSGVQVAAFLILVGGVICGSDVFSPIKACDDGIVNGVYWMVCSIPMILYLAAAVHHLAFDQSPEHLEIIELGVEYIKADKKLGGWMGQNSRYYKNFELDPELQRWQVMQCLKPDYTELLEDIIKYLQLKGHDVRNLNYTKPTEYTTYNGFVFWISVERLVERRSFSFPTVNPSNSLLEDPHQGIDLALVESLDPWDKELRVPLVELDQKEPIHWPTDLLYCRDTNCRRISTHNQCDHQIPAVQSPVYLTVDLIRTNMFTRRDLVPDNSSKMLRYTIERRSEVLKSQALEFQLGTDEIKESDFQSLLPESLSSQVSAEYQTLVDQELHNQHEIKHRNLQVWVTPIASVECQIERAGGFRNYRIWLAGQTFEPIAVEVLAS